MAKRKRKQAVAYVRVSTASSAQMHSYEFQEQYWSNKFANDPQVDLVCPLPAKIDRKKVQKTE